MKIFLREIFLFLIGFRQRGAAEGCGGSVCEFKRRILTYPPRYGVDLWRENVFCNRGYASDRLQRPEKERYTCVFSIVLYKLHFTNNVGKRWLCTRVAAIFARLRMCNYMYNAYFIPCMRYEYIALRGTETNAERQVEGKGRGGVKKKDEKDVIIFRLYSSRNVPRSVSRLKFFFHLCKDTR